MEPVTEKILCNVKIANAMFLPYMHHMGDEMDEDVDGYAERCNQCPLPTETVTRKGANGEKTEVTQILPDCDQRNFRLGLIYDPERGSFVSGDGISEPALLDLMKSIPKASGEVDCAADPTKCVFVIDEDEEISEDEVDEDEEISEDEVDEDEEISEYEVDEEDEEILGGEVNEDGSPIPGSGEDVSVPGEEVPVLSTKSGAKGIILVEIYGPPPNEPFFINDDYYAPPAIACNDFIYYPSAFARLGSNKNRPVQMIQDFYACKPNPTKAMLDSLGIAQGQVGILIEIVLTVMMTIGGIYAAKRGLEKKDFEEAELEEIEETLKYALLAARDRKHAHNKGKADRLPSDLVVSKLWDELEELAQAGGSSGLPISVEKLSDIWKSEDQRV
jgi:hypothetical protein